MVKKKKLTLVVASSVHMVCHAVTPTSGFCWIERYTITK
jgi:hypothetical protein